MVKLSGGGYIQGWAGPIPSPMGPWQPMQKF